jgi:hypothetical protein
MRRNNRKEGKIRTYPELNQKRRRKRIMLRNGMWRK